MGARPIRQSREQIAEGREKVSLLIKAILISALCSLISALPLLAAPWSGILDPSRAIDWTNAGFAIPNYTTNCATQPSLVANDPNAAAANATAIQNALASCDATHNVVNIPAGTYYVAGITYGSQGNQVLRGAGPMSTTIFSTSRAGCLGQYAGVCMISDMNVAEWTGSAGVLPPNGNTQCLWTGGYAKGTTSITLSSCGGTPPLHQTIILDQQNDTSDTGGIFMCDQTTPNCAFENADVRGRVINGVSHSQLQVTYITGVTSLGGGSYSVTISPGVYFNNIRSSQSPGAWWTGFVQHDGFENMTIDGSLLTDDSSFGTLTMFNCYECWVRNARFLVSARNHIQITESAQDVIRDSYFYQAHSHYTTSYGVESELSSGQLIENNIFQQNTVPIMFGTGTGYVVGYNYGVDDIYTAGTGFAQGSYYGHSAGNAMGLWEGNNLYAIWTDNFHGSTSLGTYFRNLLNGWQGGVTQDFFVLVLRAYHRGTNVVGNVLGQPSVQNTYEANATSLTTMTNASTAFKSIYELGATDYGGLGNCAGSTFGSPGCDPLVRSMLMRWGNYDTVTGGVRWDAVEASPAAAPYVNANFTSSYFSSLAHALPASLYYDSKPSWWPAAKAWPPVGPDVVSGNLGTCSGTYAGAQATASSQCTGGSLTSAWANHANSIPAQDCYLNVMHGPPDGTGSVLNFDANTCYYGSAASSPCDINADGSTNVVDVQQDVNVALGIVGCSTIFDINKDGTCNVIDVQRVVNAALGGSCVSP